jgi:DNA-binding CsgD family transcriptional regulator
MIHLNFIFSILCFSVGVASITVTCMLYLLYKQRVILLYALLQAVIGFILFSRMLELYAVCVSMTGDGWIHPMSKISETTGFCIGIVAGPFFTHYLLGLRVTKVKKLVFFSLGLVYLALAAAQTVLGSHAAIEHLRLISGIPILFGIYLYCLVMGATSLGKLGSRLLNISLKLLFIASTIALPFALFQFVTQKPFLPNYLEHPLSFLLLCCLSIVFALNYFNHPAYFEGNRLSGFFMDKYKITERESEIILLAMQGMSNGEIGDKLFISVRTVESHLYNIFMKTNVKNRIQLTHLIQTNKKN